MVSYHWIKESGRTVLYSDCEPVGFLSEYEHESIQSFDTFNELQEGIFKITRTFQFTEPVHSPRLTLDFFTCWHTEWAMIPAVSYNGNDWGEGNEPKGYVKDGMSWSFSFHRSSIPGCTYSKGNKWNVGLFGSTSHREPGFSCSVTPMKDHTLHQLIWPEEERPLSYSKRDQYEEGFSKTLGKEPETAFCVKAYLIIDKLSADKVEYAKLLDFAWSMNTHKPPHWFNTDEIWQLSLRYAKESLLVEDREFYGFSKGMLWQKDQWKLRTYGKYLVSWTGQNLSLANSMLFDYIKNQNTDSLRIGLKTLDTWANNATMDNGLIHCFYDYILGDEEKGTEVQDACNLSGAASNFFEAYDLAKKCGTERPLYREAALKICDFAVEHQSSDGRFGKSWYNDGTCADPEGTIGCYLVSPVLTAYQITGDEKYLKSAAAGFDYYMRLFEHDGYTTAGALDTYCIDKESAIPLLSGSLRLFEITGEHRYIIYAEKISYYLATWQWHYTVPFPEESALWKIKYDTFGGTSVSAQHHHIDPYALVFVNDWIKLSDFTDNPVWKERALAVWRNAMQGISDGTLDIYGRIRPAGSQDEGYFHTHWGYHDENGNGGFGGVSQWLVAWPAAFRLETLRNLETWTLLDC